MTAGYILPGAHHARVMTENPLASEEGARSGGLLD